MDGVKNSEKVSFFKSAFMKDWIYPFLGALVLFLLIRQFVFFNVKVPTGSMLPTIQLQDRILVTRIYNFDNIERGDILVFDSKENGKTLIKRLIGLPGDTIKLMPNGEVYVNGKLYEENYVKFQINEEKFNKGDYSTFSYGNMELGEYTIPQDHYFFLGDNRPSSIDARYWKEPYIPQEDIQGKAQIVFFPFKRFGKLR
ncbi:signal peptidase I [Oceanirhabdus sp. W0125-5]|uniref:signal peptidase I n=1 Tax=Oceanirhabdus sp. W0125-5 TaxID=2999116 RepID=UPI0022F3133D|nr:signal peptidase I [Oceanirhabdus sp. W0125-5]WBW97364.1 signal peptidase I [Oceanirhabdus sp. W0125-5]